MSDDGETDHTENSKHGVPHKSANQRADTTHNCTVLVPSGSMKSWIGPRAVESIRGRGNLASRGLIRSRLGPVVAGSTRSRLDPAVGADQIASGLSH